MRNYIIRRLLILIPTLLLLTFLIFIMVSLVPGDIVDAMQARASEMTMDRAQIEKSLGLDAPLIVQYGRWMGVIPQMDGKIHEQLQKLRRVCYHSIASDFFDKNDYDAAITFF